jgi:hypothetical protein
MQQQQCLQDSLVQHLRQTAQQQPQLATLKAIALPHLEGLLKNPTLQSYPLLLLLLGSLTQQQQRASDQLALDLRTAALGRHMQQCHLLNLLLLLLLG